MPGIANLVLGIPARTIQAKEVKFDAVRHLIDWKFGITTLALEEKTIIDILLRVKLGCKFGIALKLIVHWTLMSVSAGNLTRYQIPTLL